MLNTVFSVPCIAVVGLGIEGNTTISWLRRKGFNGKIIAADLNEKPIPPGADEAFFGGSYLENINKIPIIFRSPGIPLEKLINAGCSINSITSQSAIILANCSVIGVTGTKGKSTVASLIAHILQKAKIPCHLVGNIGTPFFELPDDAWKDVIVAEFSSHQLLDVRNSPHIAVLLEIVPEHLDYYKYLELYVQAKMNIVLHQFKNDVLIAFPHCQHGKQAITNAKGTVITIGYSGDEDFIVNGSDIICPGKTVINSSFLRGSHNVANVAAALAACSVAGVKVEDSVKHAKDFLPLPYRLETVAIVNGIEFVDDPLATTPEALIAAMKAFEGRIGAIICGGHERNQDYSRAAQTIVKSDAKLIVAFPTTGERITSKVLENANISGKHVPEIIATTSMEQAVSAVLRLCSPGDVCLHSPGAPSFGQFHNYKDRSKAFRKAISSFAT